MAVRLNDLDQLVELHLPIESFTCFGGECNCTCGIRTQTDTLGIKKHGGGKVVWFTVKVFVLICFFILLRAAIPRPRYDQLMSLGWKVMLPLTLFNLAATGAIALWMEG